MMDIIRINNLNIYDFFKSSNVYILHYLYNSCYRNNDDLIGLLFEGDISIIHKLITHNS